MSIFIFTLGCIVMSSNLYSVVSSESWLSQTRARIDCINTSIANTRVFVAVIDVCKMKPQPLNIGNGNEIKH